jgi:hypothetical protein
MRCRREGRVLLLKVNTTYPSAMMKNGKCCEMYVADNKWVEGNNLERLFGNKENQKRTGRWILI